jgi:hypothetical protein
LALIDSPSITSLPVSMERLTPLITIDATRILAPASVPPEALTTDVVINHSLLGNEGEPAEKVKTTPTRRELWIVGNNGAAGIGA